VTQVHVNRLLDRSVNLADFQILCIPGGFSYGDDLGAGTILGHTLAKDLADHLRSFRDRGGVIIGICNGFQVLLKSGLLIEPDAATGAPQATLAFNRQGRFEDRWIRITISPKGCAFLTEEQIWELPVAHAEGNYYTDPVTLAGLQANAQVVFRYCTSEGKVTAEANPNGSLDNIAGIRNAEGNVLGMMPHPERSAEELLGNADGRLVLMSMLESLKKRPLKMVGAG
jgi:phosphoribosylformylglycinamidine synthase